MLFHKFQALGNDFLIVRESALRAATDDFEGFSKQICDRHFGAGADGVELLLDSPRIPGADFEVRLFNADGGETPISGNGTRCAAALLIDEGSATDSVNIETQAGVKPLRLLGRSGKRFRFEMGMGKPAYRPVEVGCRLDIPPGPQTVTLLNVGNPQCVLLVPEFPENWQEIGRAIESHPRFPRRTNVSFVKVLDRHVIDARFYERGAGPTLSSGTGATGAAVRSIDLRGLYVVSIA